MQLKTRSTYKISLAQSPQENHILELMKHAFERDDDYTGQDTLQRQKEKNSLQWHSTRRQAVTGGSQNNNDNSYRSQCIKKNVLKYLSTSRNRSQFIMTNSFVLSLMHDKQGYILYSGEQIVSLAALSFSVLAIIPPLAKLFVLSSPHLFRVSYTF